MEYSQIILNRMEKLDISGYRLAKETGISESLFGKWRAKPTSKIDATTITKIADYFGITIDELLEKEQKNKPLTERERLIEDSLKIIESLPEDFQKAAHEHLQSLAELADKNKKK